MDVIVNLAAAHIHLAGGIPMTRGVPPTRAGFSADFASRSIAAAVGGASGVMWYWVIGFSSDFPFGLS